MRWLEVVSFGNEWKDGKAHQETATTSAIVRLWPSTREISPFSLFAFRDCHSAKTALAWELSMVGVVDKERTEKRVTGLQWLFRMFGKETFGAGCRQREEFKVLWRRWEERKCLHGTVSGWEFAMRV